MRRILVAAFAALSVMPGVALADDETEGEEEKAADEEEEPEPQPKPKADADEPTAGGDGAGTAVAVGKASGRMTMPGGKILLNTIVEANLAKGAAGKPFSVAPDIWYGASDKLTLGLVHSGRGITGFLTGAGRGLCFGDKEGACAFGLGKIYTTAAVEARIGLTEGGFPLALSIGAVAEAFKPDLVMSGKIGLVGRTQGKVALEVAPTVFVGITQRKVLDAGFNEEVFSLPVTLFFKLSPSFAFALQSGVVLTIQQAADSYEVPAAAGFAWWVSPKFSIDVAFGLDAVVDKNDMTKAFDGRSLSLGVGYGM
jgi:hypothetical protein